jgi:methionyl-tRNA formyltransferase
VKKNAKTLNFLRQSRADAFVVVAYGQILSPEILEMPRLGCINVHGSILPKYRGAAPVQWCIARGEKETGITTMLMDAGMDTGPMLLKAYTPIALFDNAEQVGATLGQMGADLLLETLSKLDRAEITPIPQNNDDATYAPLIQKSDYLIHWQDSGRTIHDRVRGFYPHALTTFRGQPFKVMATIPLDDPEQLPRELQTKDLSHLSGEVGSIVALWKNFGPVVQTGAGLLLLKEVQLSGKPPRSGGDLVNGSRLTIGEIFGQ